jgi:sterol 3beta-glucosyltransferase
MRAVLASLGTSGDFEPMLALAVGMRARGHHPILANSPDFADRACRHGIPFVSVGPELAQLDLTTCLEKIVALQSPLEHARAMIECVAPFVPDMVHQLDDVCADADLLVCLPFQLAGYLSHERTRIPYVAWSFSPFGAMSGVASPAAISDAINHCRQQVGLGRRGDPFADATARSRLALFATTTHLFRRPRHWPPHYHLTGYFFLDESCQPGADLARFVASGPPPIVVTFGSMRHSDRSATSHIVDEAIERAGCRAIVQPGWSGLECGVGRPNVHLASGFIPHGWLFQHAACVVHHGGAGTSAAALRAGAPSVVVPHALDQFLWAESLRACGAAVDVIPLAQLSAGRLADGIVEALSRRTDRRLSDLSARVRQEDGIQRAIGLMESLGLRES